MLAMKIDYPTSQDALILNKFLILPKGEWDILCFWPSPCNTKNEILRPKISYITLNVSSCDWRAFWYVGISALHYYLAIHLHSQSWTLAGLLHTHVSFHMAGKQKKLPRAFCQLTGGKKVQIAALTMRWRRLLGMETQTYPHREKHQPEISQGADGGRSQESTLSQLPDNSWG